MFAATHPAPDKLKFAVTHPSSLLDSQTNQLTGNENDAIFEGVLFICH
jgi:hypothetical protein